MQNDQISNFDFEILADFSPFNILRFLDERDGEIHVQPVLHRLPRPDGSTQQALQVPGQPLSR